MSAEPPPGHLLRVKQLFLDSLDVPPARRAAFLAQACGPDDALRREVLELFLLHGEQDELLDQPLDGSQALAELALPREGRVGPYRLVRELGHGGMGVVHLAERDGQQVALKLLAAGALSPELRERFRLEAEILRRMDHPGLARVLEAGESLGPGGVLQPWLAMEFVDGLPLLRYANEEELSVEERLQLMAKVCDAVRHAHQQGVVHRDLKPSNILVRANGDPVVLDFGVARIVAGDERPTELATRTGQLVGTPQYMSPEQVQADSARVGPASDAYSLGVILYELLSGQVPYEASSVSLHRAVATILSSEPVPLGSVAPMLRGNLEHIVMMALEKEPRYRYEDARALGDDLYRHLKGRPVRARGPGLVRSLRRWARGRPRLAFASAGLLVSTLLAGAWWIGTVRSVPPERIRNTYREAETLVMSALPLIYEGERTPERMAVAAGQLERASMLIDGVPALSHHDLLLRRIEKELGTAQMLLGDLSWDVAPARSACLSFERALRVPYDNSAGRMRDQQVTALESTATTDEELFGLLASAKLLHHRLWGQPGPLASANAMAESALAAQRRRWAAARAASPPGSDVDEGGLAYAWNSLTEIATDRAWFGGSADAARQAAAWSDSAYARQRLFADNWPAHGSLLFQRGRAYHALGVLSGSPTLLDTAETYLRACLEYRGPERPRVFAETREELARVALARAEARDAPSGRRQLLLASREEFAHARRALQRAHAEEVQVAAVRSADAQVFAALARETRSLAWLDSADARLSECSAAFPPTSYPRPASFHWVRRALVEQARNELTGAPGSAEASARAFTNALALSRSRGDSLVYHWVARERAGRAAVAARTP
jgi:predicted Ser/Thr protein kinase